MRYLIAVLFLAASFGAAAQTPVPPNGVIEQPGSYVLTGHLTGPGYPDPLIRIRADHVMLDLGGYIVRCNPADPSTARSHGIVAQNHGAITIRNGSVTGCFTGINAEGTHYLTVEKIDFSRNTYIGHHGAGSYAVFRGNTFADIGGFNLTPYAIGIKNPGNGCLIEHNVFRNLHRQAGYVGDGGGEGVGILHEADTEACVDRYNWFWNDELGNVGHHRNIAIWIGTRGHAVVRANTITDFPRPVFSYLGGRGTFMAYDNVIRLRTPVPESIAIASLNGYAGRNLIVGFVTGIFGGIVDAGGNAILP